MKKTISIKKSQYVFSIFLLMFCASCKKFVQIPDAPNKLPTSAVFADSISATSAVLGIYSKIIGSANAPQLLNGLITTTTSLTSDELYNSNNTATSDVQFYSNSVNSSSNSTVATLWANGYTYIYQANACIEGLTTSTGLSAPLKNQLIGECKVLRALCYFQLVNLFGGVPLITSTDYRTNQSLPRASVTSIYDQMIADLTSAETLLSPIYPTVGRVRINQYVAASFLAKVYLYNGKWSNAEAEASKVINSGVYSLVPNLNNVFLAGSNEAIWQLPPLQSGFETSEGYTFVPGSSSVIPKYSISTYLLNDFEIGDQRKNSWINNQTVKGNTYYYPYKYKLGRDGNTTPKEYYMIFRLADEYLIRAEARVQLGESNAINDLNIIRNRAGLLNYAGATDMTSLLNAVYHERRIEFFCEMGNRWYDIKRTNQANAIMSVVTPTKGGGWSSNWLLYPIPLAQIQANPFLTQNIGY